MNDSIHFKNTTGWLAATVLVLGLAAPALAGRGGKGGGGGTDPGPGLIPAPVEYQVTLVDWPEPSDAGYLLDVNSEGYAVGVFMPTATGHFTAVLANANGDVWNLNDRGPDGIFADALQPFTGWRFNGASQITANGVIAGMLVPETEPSANGSDDVVLVIGNIYDRTLSVVDLLENNTFNAIGDFTETGDLLVNVRGPEMIPGVENHVLLRYPNAIAAPEPQVILIPEGATEGVYPLWRSNGMNAFGEVAFSAQLTTYTTSTRGKKTTTTTSTAAHTFLSDSNGDPWDLGASESWTQISEDGSVYSTLNGIPSRWSPTTRVFEPIAPSGSIQHASKSATGEEVLLASGGLTSPWFVYKRDLGTFEVNVTSGLNGPADVTELYSFQYRYCQRISQPPGDGAHGYLAGYAGTLASDGQERASKGFILTPTQP